MNSAEKIRERRGREWVKTVRRCLRLMRELEEGAQMSAQEEALARGAKQALTQQQRTYLRLYYAAMLTQEQIAMLMGRHLSNVSRCLSRAEDNLDRVLKG